MPAVGTAWHFRSVPDTLEGLGDPGLPEKTGDGSVLWGQSPDTISVVMCREAHERRKIYAFELCVISPYVKSLPCPAWHVSRFRAAAELFHRSNHFSGVTT
jgi:hypothetical protein